MADIRIQVLGGTEMFEPAITATDGAGKSLEAAARQLPDRAEISRMKRLALARPRERRSCEPDTYRIDAPKHHRPAQLHPTRVKVVAATQLHLVIDSGAR